MATEPVPFRFNGLLIDGQTTGQQSAPYDRVLKRVQLSMGNAALPPVSDCQIQVYVNNTVVAQIFTLPTGTRYADIPCTISIPAGIQFYFQVVAKGAASDLDVLCSLDSGAVAPSGADVDCGLGMLHVVKAHILASSLASGTEYDRALATIAKGVAAMFDRYCNRRFARAVGSQELFSGDRRHLYLARFPIESVSSVELLTTTEDGWQTLDNAVFNRDDSSGLIFLAAMQGWSWTQVRVTFTGGYWYDQTSDDTGTLPSGATALPEDVTLAWLTQIQHVWDNRDNLGMGLLEKPGHRAALQSAQITELVRQMLRGHIRYVLT